MASPADRGRLAEQGYQLTNRAKTVALNINGKPVHAYQGDTVASALYASGTRIFSRSFKYHRSRGLLCVSGQCANCLVTVDGIPNVRACTERVVEGMDVRQQNAWPSVEHDAMSIIDRFDRLMPVGFYYKTFHTPKAFWKLAQPIIRRMTGLGSVPGKDQPIRHIRHEYAHADVAVVGGGPAGMSAALAAAGSGAQVTVIDDQPSLGGHLRYDVSPHNALPGMGRTKGYEAADRLRAEVEASANISVLSDANAFGLYEGNLLGIDAGNRTIKLRAKRIIVATGSIETPLTFDRNDLPGVMLTTGLQRLMHLYGVRPGSTAIVGTTGDQGYQAALDMFHAGLRVAVVADARPEFPADLEAAAELQAHGVLILPSHALTRAEGVKKAVGAVVTRLDNGRITMEERQFDGDVIAMSGGFQPASGLLHQLGAGSTYDSALDETLPKELPAGLHAAGEVNGVHDLSSIIAQGRQTGIEAFAALGGNGSASVTQESQKITASSTAVTPEVDMAQGAKQFVCFCEDVTARDLAKGIDEGFADVQTLKRYSTVTQGPCQGKMCHRAFAQITAGQTGKTMDETGATTSRPPMTPVSLGALAGPSHRPIKHTSMDRLHRELGAQMIDSNVWHRPRMYGSPQEEAANVRQGVGIIDVSTLGKLDVRGVDAPALLDKLYTHHFSTLRPGRVRYGVICSDNGTIMDDGTVTRLADDHYFVTTSTASVETIEGWFKWWMAGTDMCAHVMDITSGFAAINVAGPLARETLAKLTDVDVSVKGFRYMRSKRGDVAGVPTTLLRIGFVGESGWELHFPAEYGEHMWGALMEAGAEFGIKPFGTEAQRILRLEKMHIISNHDTDILSNPIDADMEWVVKLEKQDFIGRGALVAATENPGRTRLVGFVMQNGVVPHDGSPVVAGFAPIGKVTSSRLSPTIGKGFGLAWVPVDLAEEGKSIQILVDGKTHDADVTLEPVYDPDGKKLRE
jgi:sarcosine oxidase, subunit alpha